MLGEKFTKPMEVKIMSSAKRKAGIFLILFLTSHCGNGKKEGNQQTTSPEFQAAKLKIESIDPDNDSVDQIIQYYKDALKEISKRVKSTDPKIKPTPEEKYLYFLADTALLFHQLVKFLNAVAKAIISGQIDQNSLQNIINSLPQSPPARISVYQEESNLPYGCYQTSTLSGTICTFLDSIFLQRMENNLKILREIESENPNIKVEIKRVPVKIQLIVFSYYLDFGGEHSGDMIYFFDSLLSLIDALFRFTFSISIPLPQGVMDIPTYLSQITSAGLPSLSEDPILHGGRILTYLLINNGELLKVSSAVEVKRARYQLSQALEKTQKFINFILEKNINTTNTIFYYDTEKEVVKLRYKRNGKSQDVEILKRSDAQNFANVMQKINTNLNQTGNQLISTRDLSYVASVLLVGLIKSGIIDPILDIVIKTVGSTQQTQLVQKFLSSDLFQPTFISNVISSVLGDVIYFDFGTMFSNLSEFSNLSDGKTSLRDWLPAWSIYHPIPTNTQKITDKFRNNFAVEWDCGAKLYDDSITQYREGRKEFFGLSCTSPQPQPDTTHFPKTITFNVQMVPDTEYPADGVFLRFPYILFQDASFGGLILIKGYGILGLAGQNSSSINSFLQACGVDTGTTPKSYFQSQDRKKGSCALSIYLQLLIENILNFISSQGG
ncbi:hypothetical protein HRbin19_00619 [bacterium HR19]|nr:hypothetical protein HRbin19_00619 [bacterium HR19]